MRPRVRIGLAGLGPIKSVYLDIMVYFSTWLNKLYKARVGIRLVKLLSNITLVGAVCRMFGANIYARIRGVHALEHVIWLWRDAIPSFFFFSSFLLPLKFQFIPTLLEIINSSVNILLNILCMNV